MLMHYATPSWQPSSIPFVSDADSKNPNPHRAIVEESRSTSTLVTPVRDACSTLRSASCGDMRPHTPTEPL
ncbi:hypothetical protein EVAR_26892_1 [Eumeta japonica]|uniref:Uncharacterized protein n=1 Tax=Eumeta variegata TaxID=151549 RepID=A0A4C1VTD3_EUMVA|nr:hypothetical protein EVAR_26892_1 [Eumeta japonica]